MGAQDTPVLKSTAAGSFGVMIPQGFDPVGNAWLPVLLDSNGNMFVNISSSLGTGAVSVVPSDTVDLSSGVTKGIYVGVEGDITVKMSDDTVVTFKALAPGTIHPIAVKRVYATGTSATNILAVY